MSRVNRVEGFFRRGSAVFRLSVCASVAAMVYAGLLGDLDALAISVVPLLLSMAMVIATNEWANDAEMKARELEWSKARNPAAELASIYREVDAECGIVDEDVKTPGSPCGT